MVYVVTFSQTIYFAHQPTSLPCIQTYTQTILQTLLHPTYLPNPYIPTLHTYIPTLPLQTYKTLHTCPIPAYLYYTYNHYTPLCIPALSLHTSSKSRQSYGAIAFCPWGNTMYCVLAKLLHLNLISLLRTSCRRKGCWIPTKICNSGRLYNHYCTVCGVLTTVKSTWWREFCSKFRPSWCNIATKLRTGEFVLCGGFAAIRQTTNKQTNEPATVITSELQCFVVWLNCVTNEKQLCFERPGWWTQVSPPSLYTVLAQSPQDSRAFSKRASLFHL